MSKSGLSLLKPGLSGHLKKITGTLGKKKTNMPMLDVK